MKNLLYLQWVDQGQSKMMVKAIPVEVSEPGAAKLLAKNKGVQYPTYIRMEDAARYEVSVTIENLDTPVTPKPVPPKRKRPVISKEQADIAAGKSHETVNNDEQNADLPTDFNEQ